MDQTTCNNENGVSLLRNATQIESTEATKNGGALYKYRNNSAYRKKIQLSVCIGYLAFTLGWVKGQVGPSFPDILQITDTNLERGSAFITSFYVGRIVGSLSGILYDRCRNKHAFLAVVCIANGITVALIPWCSMFELMVTVYFFHGAFAAAMDVGSTAASFAVWGRASLVFYQAYQFLVSMGGILSPLAVAPFLAKSIDVKVHNLTTWNSSYSEDLWNSFHTSLSNVTVNGSALVMKDNEQPREGSKLYIAYFIAAVLVSVSGVLFIIFCGTPMEQESEEQETFISAEDNPTKKPTKSNNNHGRLLSQKARNFAILNTCLFSGLYTAVELGMGNFLTVFCLRHMGWSKLNGVFAVSIFYLLFMIGRLFGIVIVKLFKSLKILCFCMIMTTISFAVLLVCAYYLSDTGVWICTGVTGLSISMLFPIAISWTNKAVAPVLGTVSTLIFVTSYVGPFINPPLMSFLMNSYDYMWFCYILLLECVLMFFTYLVMVWFGKRRNVQLNMSKKLKCDK